MLVKDVVSNEYDLSLIKQFSNKYVKNKGADNTKKLARIILE
jgi:hypothetical protein